MEPPANNSLPPEISTPTNNIPPPQSIAPAAPTPVTLQTKPKRSKKGLVALALCLLVLAGLAVWWFGFRSTTQLATTQSASSTSQPASLFVSATNYTTTPNTQQLLLLNPTTRTSQTIFNNSAAATTKGLAFTGQVKTGSGYRRFYTQNTSTTNTTTTTFFYQDGTAAPKSFFSSKQNTDISGPQVWSYGLAISPDGRGVYYLESNLDPVANTAIKRANIDGTVQTMATAGTSIWGLGSKYTNTSPSSVSQDGKTVYFAAHSCLYCDGPQQTALVSMDVATRKFSLLYADPTPGMYGNWTTVNDTNFLIYSTNTPNLGAFSYEDVNNTKATLTLYNTKDKSTKQIYNTGSTAQDAQVLGVSRDKSTVYFAPIVAVKGKAQADTDKNGNPVTTHAYSYIKTGILAYSLGTGKLSQVNVPIDFDKYDIALFTSDGPRLYYDSTSTATDANGAITQPPALYMLDLSNPGATPVELYKMPATGAISLVGFAE